MRKMLRDCIATALLVTGTVHAQDYAFPVPFQHFNASFAQVTLNVVGTDPTYGMWFFISQTAVVPTLAQAGPTAADFMYYVRPKALTSVRYEFEVDTSELTGDTDSSRSVQLFAASSPVVISSWPQLLTIDMIGGTPYPSLRFRTPRGGNQPIEQITIPLTASTATLRVEINVGSGTAGNVRYWINAAYVDPPTGILNNAGAGLDNAAWTGVIAAAVGMSSMTDAFRANAGGTFAIYHIASSDDLLFWDDFSFGYQ